MSALDVSIMIAGMGTTLSAVATLYVGRQVADGRRFVKAQLLNEIESEYCACHYPTYNLLLPGEPWSPTGPGPEGVHDLHKLEAYLEFFEKIALIIDTGALDLRTIDKLYAFRFFILLNNPHTERLIHRDEPYWPALISLHRVWTAYRQATCLPIPNIDHRFLTFTERMPDMEAKMSSHRQAITPKWQERTKSRPSFGRRLPNRPFR